MKYLVFLLFLTGCGTPQVFSAQSSVQCEQINICTYASVPGYQCVPITLYDGSTCKIVSADQETDPSCDPSAPNAFCGNSWAGPVYPCCKAVWGPGPAPSGV